MKINTVGHFIGDAFKSLKRNKTICLASIITVLITFFVLGIFVLVSKNVGLALSGVQSKVELKVFLQNDIKMVDQRALEIKLKDMPQVKDVQYVSRDQAFIDFQKSSQNNKGILEGYTLANNPFPASFTVQMKVPEDAQTVANAVENMPGVDSIGNQQDLINTITKIVNGVNIIGGILFLILIGVAVFLIMNTTKLTVYSRRREVGIMKFVGATDWFIRWPFIIEGMIIGLIGAVLSTIVIGLAYQGFFSWITSKMLYVNIVSTSYVYSSLLWMFALGGIVVGGAASYFSLRKFLVV
ncbi:MAG: permease-like cell division protein FtsX [Clostridium sp.]|uniref:permease-like cell division protein FtsX n=1 Tax=Clostridium sp. TaxID=1506 RepID=UPI003F397AEC